MRAVRDVLADCGAIKYSLSEDSRSVVLHADLAEFFRDIPGFASLPRIDSSKLSALVAQFHDLAGTQTPQVTQAIERLRAGSSWCLRQFHQPNTLAGLNICGLSQIAAYCLDARSDTGQDGISVFIFMDYDEGDDKRFRTPVLPGPGATGGIRLTGAVPRRQRHQVACSLPSPSMNVVTNWISQIKNNLRLSMSSLHCEGLLSFNEARSRFEELEAKLIEVFSRHGTLTIANSLLQSWLVNVLWGLDTLFVPGSWLLPLSYSKMISVLRSGDDWWCTARSEAERFSKDVGVSPGKLHHPRQGGAWRICYGCLSRVPLVVEVATYSTHGRWHCMRCGIEGAEEIDEYKNLETSFCTVSRIVPAVLLCDLLELVSYGMSVGVNYAGSADHVLWSRIFSAHYEKDVAVELFCDPGLGLIPKRVRVSEGGLQEHGNLLSQLMRGRAPAVLYWTLFDPEVLRLGVVSSAKSYP